MSPATERPKDVQVIAVRITPSNGASRLVWMDVDGYEYGHDVHGRVCRIARHRDVFKHLIDGPIRTGGNNYQKV